MKRFIAWFFIAALLCIAIGSVIFLFWPQSSHIFNCEGYGVAPNDPCSPFNILARLFLSGFTFLNDYNGALIALLTGLVFVVTRQQKDINARQVSHFERKERAWLYPENFNTIIERAPPRNTRYVLSMVWRNGGNTTALKVRMNILSEIFVGDMPADHDFESRYDKVDKPTYIGPNATASTQYVAIRAEEVQAVFDGHLTFFIWGRIDYEDIFIGTENRQTKFCWQLTGGVGDPILNEKVGLNFNHSDRYSSIS